MYCNHTPHDGSQSSHESFLLSGTSRSPPSRAPMRSLLTSLPLSFSKSSSPCSSDHPSTTPKQFRR
jgi:hypothetical protein